MATFASYFPITDPTLVFFVVLIIILLAPVIMGKLRIPHLIGMVLAGVAIGKYGLNVLVRDSSFELFGRVGLYYIMFLASLEMDMEDLRKNKWRTLTFGLLTFGCPFFLTWLMGIDIPSQPCCWLASWHQTRLSPTPSSLDMAYSSRRASRCRWVPRW